MVAEGRRDPRGDGEPKAPRRTTDHMLACCSGESRIQAPPLTSRGIWSLSLTVSTWCQTQAQRLAHEIRGQALTY